MKTLENLAPKYWAAIESISDERENGNGFWIYLKHPYTNPGLGYGVIHEQTETEAVKILKGIVNTQRKTTDFAVFQGYMSATKMRSESIYKLIDKLQSRGIYWESVKYIEAGQVIRIGAEEINEGGWTVDQCKQDWLTYAEPGELADIENIYTL